MANYFPGILLKKKRLEKNWNQEGLCRGICAVSYLSKVEQGKAQASDEILRLLFARLGITWHNGEDARAAEALAEALYDAVFSLDDKKTEHLFSLFKEDQTLCLNGPYMLDFLLLAAYTEDTIPKELSSFVPAFDSRQMTLWLLLQKEYDRAITLRPCAFTYALAGAHAYRTGDYAKALEQLRYGFQLASEDCYIHIMLLCRLFMGNCYSDLDSFDRMLMHYKAARRLAEALGAENTLSDINYNEASTAIQLSRYQEAYDYFSRLTGPNAMSLHKLAICCEGLGKKEEALSALQRAKTAPTLSLAPSLVPKMCALVEYRLTHPDYLHEAAYGSMLTACFTEIKRELPIGYALFHLRWLEEWYTANRQYRQAYELLKSFPKNT